MSQSDLEHVYADIRQRVTERYRQRLSFARTFVIWIFFGLLFVFTLGSIWELTLILFGFWTMVLAYSGLKLSIEGRRESAIRHEFEHYVSISEKSKRVISDSSHERLVTLHEDGELFDFEENDSRQERL